MSSALYALWNVTLERSLGRDSAASIGYLGALEHSLLRREGYLDPFSPRPRLVLARAHAIDTWDSATYLVFRGVSDKASANFDVRHSFQAALSYDLGRMRARGWTLSGTFRARTGFPLDMISADHPFGLGFDNDVRPDLVPGVPVGRQGSLGRNAFTGFALTQLDLALQRAFVASERARVQLRVETYNLNNSPNYADPVRTVSSPLFGRPPSPSGDVLRAAGT